MDGEGKRWSLSLHSVSKRQEYTLERCAKKITVGLELDRHLFTEGRNRTEIGN